MNYIPKTLLFVILLGFTKPELSAAVVKFEFGGSVTSVIGNTTEAASVGVQLGAAVTGSLSFDDSVVDTAGTTQLGLYSFSGAPNSFEMTVGILNPSVDDLSISVSDGVTDSFDVTASGIPFSEEGFSFNHFRLLLQDAGGGLFADDSLPGSALDFDSTTTSLINLWEDDGGFLSGEEWRLQVTITSFTSVPEPSALILLGFGGLGLVLRRSRRFFS